MPPPTSSARPAGATRWRRPDPLRVPRGATGAHRRRITFEYVMLAGQSDADAAPSAGHVASGLRAKVNLIPFNRFRNVLRLEPAPAHGSARTLHSHGVKCDREGSRGDDIQAACGQFAWGDRA
jgi:adenine C2-methylase RlmN of 23S rRNA A2503 and tRNA A37